MGTSFFFLTNELNNFSLVTVSKFEVVYLPTSLLLSNPRSNVLVNFGLFVALLYLLSAAVSAVPALLSAVVSSS